MPDDRTSPSGGWREVYGAMEVDTSAEAPANPCPDCGVESRCIFRRVFECDDHGVWALDATGTPRMESNPTKMKAE
ncbi:hypothetical protein [Haladaptatus caseinilyticus]|uniref:hypothetical protein n=1 Tax=Haladaptatus caseinilyticus TaxID=2993314 RepID=UPI00224B4B94|nr:hypothetical protein [Haladaptatus caseinilyticus]